MILAGIAAYEEIGGKLTRKVMENSHEALSEIYLTIVLVHLFLITARHLLEKNSGKNLLEVPSQIQKGEYADAAANVLTGALDIGTAGIVSPIYQGAKSTASELSKVLGTEEGLLSNAYKINPFAGKLGEYNRIVGRDAVDDVFESGLVRVNENAGVASDLGPFGVITRTTPYPSFAKALPQKQYANQVSAQGKQPYIISTDRAMKASTLGRHGKGTTQFPIDETGKYMSGFPASEAKIFEFADKPHWLKGYKEVSNELPGLPGGTLAYRNVTSSKTRPTNTGLTNADIDTEVAKNIKWITSPEYAARRAATTGETSEQIQKSVDDIIAAADKAKFNLNTSTKKMDFYGAEGMMSKKKWWSPAKVEISANSPNPVETLGHEVKHLYSPAVLGKKKVYENYPSLAAEDDYLTLGMEQQIRHLNAREKILAENDLPIDAQLSEEQVREFVDKWTSKMNKRFKNPEDLSLHEDYDDLWNEHAGEIQKEMLKARYNTDDLSFVSKLPTSQRVKFLSEYRDRLTRSVTNVLNKAWATVPTAGGAALLNNSDNSEENK
jgi:hypothetical protein